MDILESASRMLMSLLQDPFSTGKRRVTYSSGSPKEESGYALPNSNRTGEYGAYNFQDFRKYTTESTGLPLIALILLSIIIAYPITKAIYNIYFHPLAKYPGPVFAAATKIPVALVSWDGSLSQWQRDLHDSYRSDVIRISPDELSFIDSSAWKDLYGNKPGHERFQKDLLLYSGVKSIVTAPDADHSRIRRLLAHAFSDKALREQEGLIQVYVDNLVGGLKSQIQSPTKGKVNMTDWLQWVIFDVISDFSFGESFNCLKDTRYRGWLDLLLDNLRSVVLHSVMERFPPLDRVLKLYIPKSITNARKEHLAMSAEKVERRINTKTSRPDFLSYILKNNEGGKEAGGMTVEEIKVNAGTLISAGSETTAALLCGALWFLLTNPHCMENLLEEIRAFKKKEDINLTNLDRLQYYQAVINEAFRMYPPAVLGQPRIAPKGGAKVSGHYVPGGTRVVLNQYAANHSHQNFNSPEVFAPSRWLGNEHFAKDKREVVQPFSIGARNCIGKNLALAEIKLTLAHLLWNFEFETCEETDPDWFNQKAWLTPAKKPLVVQLKLRAR